jgi:prolyl 4-hydroxylase
MHEHSNKGRESKQHRMRFTNGIQLAALCVLFAHTNGVLSFVPHALKVIPEDKFSTGSSLSVCGFEHGRHVYQRSRFSGNSFETTVFDGRCSVATSFKHIRSAVTAASATRSMSGIDESTGVDTAAAREVTYSHTFWDRARSKEEIKCFCQEALSHQDGYEQVVNVLHADPPLIHIPNLLSPRQCDALVQAVLPDEDDDNGTGFQRSTTGAKQETSDIRTSTTTWLREDRDTKETPQEHVQAMRYLATQVSALTGMPTSHQENLQMIQYTSQQKFDIHTDHLDSFNDFHFGGRLATCLVYLNSGSELDSLDSEMQSGNCEGITSRTTFTGGETFFPRLGVSVPPTQGGALLFWNTDERPGMEGYHPDMFLHVNDNLCHSGKPVNYGIKWACNRWIHPVDYGAGVRGL